MLVLVVVVAMLAMWGYVLYLAFGPGRQPPPDRLARPRLRAAGPGGVRGAPSPTSRPCPRRSRPRRPPSAPRSWPQANDRFAAMVDDIEPLAPSGEDGEIVAEWIADWRTYLG